MPAERYFIDATFSQNCSVTIDQQEAHHLINVMRSKIGDQVELINGQGQLAQAIIADLKRSSVNLRITDFIFQPARTTHIIIAQAIPRLNRLETIIEKCTELNMDELWLFPGDLSEKKQFSDQQQQRLKSITIAAAKQSGRLWLPDLKFLEPLKNWPKKLPVEAAFFGDTSNEAPPFCRFFSHLVQTKSIVFFIGPEAGFSNKEIVLLKEFAAIGVKLHDNILRTDTAPIVALSLMEHYLLSQS